MVTVSAPGSTLITGEHAVIYGAPAIVAAIEQRATVSVEEADDNHLTITSQIAPPAHLPVSDLVVGGPYRFVIAAALHYPDRLNGGLKIDIQSQINHTLGLGSSAAVTMATLTALAGAAPDSLRDSLLHEQGLRIIHDIQGRGSGADLAASLFGGVLSYQIAADQPAKMDALPLPPQLSLFNVGYKTPTAEVLARVAAARDQDPDRINGIFDEMERLADQTIDSIKAAGWAASAEKINTYQGLMKRLGVSDDALDEAIFRAIGTPGVLAAKISGSGLGDCALAMGAVPYGFEPVELAKEGVVFHGER